MFGSGHETQCVEIISEGLKFIYSEKATKFCEIFPVKSKGKISRNFVGFSEYMNFTIVSKEQYLFLNLCQKHSFLNHLNHNITTDCSRKLQIRNMSRTCCVQKLFFICFCYDIQNNFCTQHILDMFWIYNFLEQSVVILWVNWLKNKCFWKIFTLLLYILWKYEGKK